MRIVLKQFHDIAPRVRTDIAPKVQDRKHAVPEGEAGLTLIEMMIVLVIIAVVAGMVVASGILSRPDQAKATTTKADLATIGSALKMYRLDNGDYPTTAQGLKALSEKTSVPPLPSTFPQGGYISKPALDGWGKPYEYTSEGGSFTIRSLGKDGKVGGEGVDADIEGKG
ncbi:type II secretion system major pseudopilin GspG [Sphingomonas sp. Sphisp66]|uniref:type II secretion system major pseudopilin GspG n=1 Tax=Sphingomonas sp. Sphisp66 TaxID=3243051 RepID=UPI0039B3F2DF